MSGDATVYATSDSPAHLTTDLVGDTQTKNHENRNLSESIFCGKEMTLPSELGPVPHL